MKFVALPSGAGHFGKTVLDMGWVNTHLSLPDGISFPLSNRARTLTFTLSTATTTQSEYPLKDRKEIWSCITLGSSFSPNKQTSLTHHCLAATIYLVKNSAKNSAMHVLYLKIILKITYIWLFKVVEPKDVPLRLLCCTTLTVLESPFPPNALCIPSNFSRCTLWASKG